MVINHPLEPTNINGLINVVFRMLIATSEAYFSTVNERNFKFIVLLLTFRI